MARATEPHSGVLGFFSTGGPQASILPARGQQWGVVQLENASEQGWVRQQKDLYSWQPSSEDCQGLVYGVLCACSKLARGARGALARAWRAAGLCGSAATCRGHAYQGKIYIDFKHEK